MALDKRKVIAAYRRGMITIQECGQILGLDMRQMNGILNDDRQGDIQHTVRTKQSIHG